MGTAFGTLGTASAVDAGDVTFTPTTAADWDADADPGDLDDALDELAERVTDVEERGVFEYSSSATAVFGDAGTFYNNTPFTGSCNGVPAAKTTVAYNHTAGEDSIFLGQVLHNTTKGEQVRIVSIDTGTNTITCDADSPDDATTWADLDVLTTASQTNAGRAGTFVDIDVTPRVDVTAGDPSAIIMNIDVTNQNADVWFMIMHPFEAYDVNKEAAMKGHTDEHFAQYTIPLGKSASRYYFTVVLTALAAANGFVISRLGGQFTKLVS